MCVEDRELRNTVHNDIEDWGEPYLRYTAEILLLGVKH